MGSFLATFSIEVEVESLDDLIDLEVALWSQLVDRKYSFDSRMDMNEGSMYPGNETEEQDYVEVAGGTGASIGKVPLKPTRRNHGKQ